MKRGRKGKQVIKLDLNTKQLLDTYSSAFEAGIENDVSPQNICYVCNGKRNQSAGYLWMWKG